MSNNSEVTQRSTVILSNIKVNDPNFSEDLFHIDLPKGTRVTDERLGIWYIVGEDGKDVLKPLKDKPLPDMRQFLVMYDPNQAKDNMILVCFFDMQQRPSRNCLRQLSAMSKELKAKNVVVIAIQASEVAEETFNEWKKKADLPFSVGVITADIEKTRFTWGVRSLPWLILTDKEHIVTAEGFNVSELDEKISIHSRD